MVVTRFRPIVTKGNETFDALYGVQQDEMETIKSNTLEVFNNKFIKTANLNGIERYETMYNLDPNKSMSQEERREIVYNKMTFKPPFTFLRLDLILQNVFGKNNYSYSVNPKTLEISITIPNKISKKVYDRYMLNMRKIIPANVYIILATPYTYVYLGSLTYEQLAEYKYYELSQYSVYPVSYPRFASGWTSGDDVGFDDPFMYGDDGIVQYVC